MGFRDRFSAWLVEHGAEAESIPSLLDAYCGFLNGEAFAIHRCSLATDTIHPQMTGMRHVWYREAVEVTPINPAVLVDRRQYCIGEALIDEVFFNSQSQQNPQFKASPFYQIELRGELYERIGPAGSRQPYPLFDDLAAEGCTAYFGMVLKSFAGMLQKVSLATSRDGGLDPDCIDDLRWTLSLLTLHLNTLIEFSIKNTLARVYLGRDPGKRVSDGMIAAGDVISLEGAIWFSDLRGFTETSGRLPPEELVALLNEYFATVVAPIYAGGGEVLKYIGDAILAVFPASSFADAAEACRAALEAAAEADERLQALNGRRAATRGVGIAHGIGLHYGKAHYGNVGVFERLDFTLIGREVNIASRIEGLTKELAGSPLCSAAFAAASGLRHRSLGDFALKGVTEPVEIFQPQVVEARPSSPQESKYGARGTL